MTLPASIADALAKAMLPDVTAAFPAGTFTARTAYAVVDDLSTLPQDVPVVSIIPLPGRRERRTSRESFEVDVGIIVAIQARVGVSDVATGRIANCLAILDAIGVRYESAELLPAGLAVAGHDNAVLDNIDGEPGYVVNHLKDLHVLEAEQTLWFKMVR